MAGQATERLVAGRYELNEPLGKGGMGVVWRGVDTSLKRAVAVKEIKLPHTVPTPERASLRARVMREARAAARLGHPSVVTIYDVVEEDGTAYIVMELVDAPTLADVIEASGPLSSARAARVGLDVLAALEAAHAEGIVHRDVKPANVMVPEEGSARLADFGIASVKDDPKITTTGMILGSPAYMAPEQATGQVTRPETDLWALGATLYFAVEGKSPFDRGSAIPTLTAVVNDEPRPTERAGPLAGAIESLLDKSPEQRPSHALARALLEGAERGEAPAATVPAEGAVETTPRRPQPAMPAGGRGRPTWPWLVALLGVLAVAVATLIVMNGDPPDPPGKSEAGRRDGGNQEAAGIGPTTVYEVPGAGYSVRYPSGWTVEEGSVDADSVDLRDEATGTYLRLDWTSTPGPDALAAWEQLEEGFSARHEGYRRVALETVDFPGAANAALWEFTWVEEGVTLHAYDLGLVTEDRDYGFALNFVAREQEWEDAQPLWEAIRGSFEGP